MNFHEDQHGKGLAYYYIVFLFSEDLIRVKATVTEHTKTAKVIVFKKKRRKNYKRKQGTVFTRLEGGGGGGGGGLLFIKINLQTRLLIVTRLVNEA